MRRRRAACSERMLYKERRKSLNSNMLLLPFVLSAVNQCENAFYILIPIFFQYFVLGVLDRSNEYEYVFN